MKENETYYIRIDSKAVDEKPPADVFNSHISYLTEIAEKTEFYGGGFVDFPGGMIIFKADDDFHAETICKNDPLIKSGYYRYTLRQWEVVISCPPKSPCQ